MNLKRVHQKEFFQKLNQDSRDIMPLLTSKTRLGDYISEWRVAEIKSQLFGLSYDKKYFLNVVK